MQITSVLDSVLQHKPVTSRQEVYYPERDGKPLGETDWHISAILYLLGALRYVFRRTTDVYVAADMLFYYEEGNPSVFKVPDVYVVRGVSKAPRRIYKLWEEKVTPCTIFEVTSRGTRWEDAAEKKGLYEFLGVREYFMFDPLAEYLKPRLQGFRLIEGRYAPIAPSRGGALVSDELGVILRPVDYYLRVVDPTTNAIIPSMEEAAEQAEEARQQAEIETARAQAEAERAQAEAGRAQAEAHRADTAEAELARLRAELAALKRQGADEQ
jgi:Uma2 family endonuclease